MAGQNSTCQEIRIIKEADPLPSREIIDGKEERGGGIGCLVDLVVFGYAIYRIVNLVRFGEYGFVEIAKQGGIFLGCALIVCIVLNLIIGWLLRMYDYNKKVREWENGKFKRFCDNTHVEELYRFNPEATERKLDKIEANLKMMEGRMSEVRKMAKDAKERS